MLGLDSNYPPLLPHANAKDCVRWLRALMYWAGPCFHPEEPADLYIYKDDAGRIQRSFTPALCIRMDGDMERCYRILQACGKDPCAIAIKPQRRMLRRI